MGLRSILCESWAYSCADPWLVARFDHVAAFRSPWVGHDKAQSYANLGFRAMAGRPLRGRRLDYILRFRVNRVVAAILRNETKWGKALASISDSILRLLQRG